MQTAAIVTSVFLKESTLLRGLYILPIVFAAHQAKASIECTVKIFAGDKRSESKITLKPTDEKPHYYEAEREGYIFTASGDDESNPRWIKRIAIHDKSDPSKLRAVSSYTGSKADTPKGLMTALVREASVKGPTKSAVMFCELEKISK